jgi:hypothetical protein
MMSQDYPEDLFWLLGDGSVHELFLFENGREGLAKIDCRGRNTDVEFKIKAPNLTEVYVYPGIFDGNFSLAQQGGYSIKSSNELFTVVFKNQFSKLFDINIDSEIEFVYLYFRWNEGYNIDLLIEKCFVCEIKNEEWPISFSIERTTDQRAFNHKRNSIYTHKSQKYIHAKQLITLEMLKHLDTSGSRLFNEDYRVTYVGSDDSSNFETSLSYLFELRKSECFKDIFIRANSRYDDLQLDSIEKLYQHFTGHTFVQDDVVQNHEEDWNSDCDLIIDTFTIQTWGQKPNLLCSSILTFVKELRKRIMALNDNGALILVTPEPLSAFGRIYPDSKEGLIEDMAGVKNWFRELLKEGIIDDKFTHENWFRGLHEKKIGYFLQKLLKIIGNELDNCSIKMKVYDYPGIGGGVVVRKEKADEFNQKADEFNQKEETDLESRFAEHGEAEEGESATSYSDFVRKSVEILNWRESRNEQS